MWAIEILLHYVTLPFVVDLLGNVEGFYLGHCLLKNMVYISGQENSLALTQTIWFHDIGNSLAGAVIQITDPVVPQICRFIRQHPSLWEKVVLLRELLIHTH